MPDLTVPMPGGAAVRRGKLHLTLEAARTLRASIGGVLAAGKSGRPRSDAARCPCGLLTVRRAEQRGHRCEG